MSRGLIIIAVIGVCFIVDLAAVASSNDKGKNEAVCLESVCTDTATKILQDLDPEVDPCDNFYDFACGGYAASEPIPDHQTSVDRLSSLRRDIESQLRLFIEEPSSPNEARPFKLAKTLYRTCMDTDALEKAGLDPLREILREFGNWPVIEGPNWKEDEFSWTESVYRSRKLGYSINNFVTLIGADDWRNTTNFILALDQPDYSASLDDLIEGEENYAVEAYFDYMTDIAVLLGAEKLRAVQELQESLQFEIELAKIALSKTERKNLTLLHTTMTISELNKEYPFVNWEEYINKLLPLGTHVNANEVIALREPNFIRGLGELLRDTPKRVQANYALWRVIAQSVEYLNEDLRKRQRKYHVDIDVTPINDLRWRECLDIVTSSALSISTSTLYLKNYFKRNEEQTVVEIITDVKSELIKALEKADWMDEKSRSRATEKTRAMTSRIAYSVELLDEDKLEKFYANLTLRPNDLLGSILDVNRLETDNSLQQLRKPDNGNSWIAQDYSTDPKPYYDYTDNSIQIPAGLLQGTVFRNDRPRYLNYGALGILIAHLATHNLDNDGRQLDERGNLEDWWTPETAEKYLQKAQCFITQYSNYTVESVGLSLDGVKTLEENIADNVGAITAYRAYKEYVKRNGPEPKLPGLKFTPEQLFWISAASNWCIRYRPETKHLDDRKDGFSTERFRVIGSFINAPEFANDFNCPVGSYMNPPNKCSLL